MYRKIASLLSVAAVSCSSLPGAVYACPQNGNRVAYHAQPVASRVVRTVYASTPAPARTSALAVSATKVSVTAVAPRPALPEIEVGATVTANANFLGGETGYALLHLGTATMECEIVEWTGSSVTFKAPNVGLRHALAGQLELVRPDGRIVRQFHVQLTPRPALLVRADLQQLEVPTSAGGAALSHTADAGDLLLETAVAPPAPEVTAAIVVGD